MSTIDYFPLKVIDITEETDDAKSFFFEIPSELRAKYEYLSGQFLDFNIPWQDFFVQRSYSLSSAPCIDACPSITVKRVKDGRVSNWFNDEVKPGMEIHVSPPSGRFILRNNSENPIVLFAGGSGITPVISIIKTALHTSSRHLFLVYANQHSKSVIFKNQIKDLTQLFTDRFDYYQHLDSENGYLTTEIVNNLIADYLHADFYICGPGPFMDQVEVTLLKREVDRQHIFIERFASPIDSDRQTTEQTGEASKIDNEEVKLSITLNNQNYSIPYLPGSTILESVLACHEINKDNVPHSCQQGHCGACMSILKQGEVTMRTNKILSKRDLAAGYVLACQALPETTEVWVNFDD